MRNPTISTKLSKWYNSNYDKKIGMMALDHKITVFVCLTDGCVRVIEGLTVSQDLLE